MRMDGGVCLSVSVVLKNVQESSLACIVKSKEDKLPCLLIKANLGQHSFEEVYDEHINPIGKGDVVFN